MATSNPTDADEMPSSPTTFKHTTTNPAPKHPFLDTSITSINIAPVELDSTPVSPVARKESWKIKGLGQGAGLGAGSTVGPGEEEDVYGELSGEKGGNEVTREKRKQLLAERSRDPAVLVDLPQTPRAEEYEVATVRKVVAAVETKGVGGSEDKS